MTVFDVQARSARQWSASVTNNILIVKLSGIGDVVLSLPALHAIRQANPGAKISFLVGSAPAPLLFNHPDVDDVLSIDDTIFWRRKFLGLYELFRQLKKRQYTSVYIFQWSVWFHFFFYLMRIPQRYGFARGGRSFALTKSMPYTEASGIHDATQYLSVVSEDYLQQDARNIPPEIHFNRKDEEILCQSLSRTSAARYATWITVAPGGGKNAKLFMPQKRWPARNFSQLILRLLQDESTAVFLVGDESDGELMKEYGLPSDRVISFAGQLGLRETGLLIQRSRLFAGNDSGLLHIAGAVGTPSLSFFGPTSPSGKLPVWAPHRALYTQEVCSPCYHYGAAPDCPFELKCLTNISVDSAWNAAKSLLEGQSHG